MNLHRPFIALIAVLTLLLTLGACGKGDGKDDEGEDLALTSTVVGTWSGKYMALGDNGAQIGDASDVKVVFTNDTFSIVFKENPTAKAEGEWQDFRSESLLLKIQTSSISRLQVSNSEQEFPYTLAGNKLDVVGTSFKLKLGRVKETGAQPDNPSPQSVAGRWICENGSLVTRLQIDASLSWRGTIASANSSALVVSGSGHADGTGTYILRIDAAQPSVKAGSTLHFSYDGGSGSLVAMIDQTSNQLGTCRRE